MIRIPLESEPAIRNQSCGFIPGSARGADQIRMQKLISLKYSQESVYEMKTQRYAWGWGGGTGWSGGTTAPRGAVELSPHCSSISGT